MKVYYEIYRTDTGYAAHAPCFPGYLATDSTIEGVRRKMRKSLKAHIQWLADDGDPLPPEAVESGYLAIEIKEPEDVVV
ncbi:MAG: hypothetical protein LBV15_04595 [Planctomycetota bacterium]|jgi:predicted RNase H-like HicB family nuclease|nr:hypothetical protein [Planctomycetota bacterium]